MRGFTLLLTIFLLCSASVFSQTVENPVYKSSDDPTTTIAKIESASKYTVLTFEHRQASEGWISLSKSIYLQNANGDDIYRFVKAEGIPLSPARKNLKGDEGKFVFKVYFEKVPSTVKTINVIERAIAKTERGSYFNYFGVSLDPSGKALKDATMIRI